jgi:putative transposase
MGVDGRKVLLSLSPAYSASSESCLEGLRALIQRGLLTPVTITTDGAPGLITVLDLMWPRSLRMRCWLHKMQSLAAHLPAPAWPSFKALVADMRDAPTFEEGQRRFHGLLEQ